MRVLTVLLAAAWIGGVGCASPPPDLTPLSGVTVDAPEATFEGRTVRAGDRVRLVKRSGTFKPESTGHDKQIEGGAGHVGLALGGMRRSWDPAGAPITLALVRWDKQVWVETETGAEVELEAFEATVHLDHIRTMAD